jgi:hypothetical protein
MSKFKPEDIYTIGKKTKDTVKIVIPLGTKGFNSLLKSKRNPVDVILSKVIKKLESLGYDEIQIGRAIFEEALDVETATKLKFIALIVKKYRKVPKQLIFYVPVEKYID